jgi:hypothetical protein
MCVCALLLLLQETCDALSVFGIQVKNNTRTGVGRTYSHACTYVIGKRQQKWALLGECLSPPQLVPIYSILFQSILSCSNLLYLVPIYSILFQSILSCSNLLYLVPIYSILFQSTLSCFNLFYLVPIYSILFQSTLSCSNLLYLVPIYSILFHSTLSCSNLLYLVPIYSILFYSFILCCIFPCFTFFRSILRNPFHSIASYHNLSHLNKFFSAA